MPISHENRFLVKQDDNIPQYRTWNFKKLQWHSRPYEYKYAVDRVADLGSDLDILDLGCGVKHPGYLMLAELENVASVDALDLSNELLSNGHDHAKVRKVVADIFTWDKDKFYDVVVCVSTVEHIEKYQQVFQTIAEILKPGGYLVLTIDIYTGPKKAWKYNIRNIQPSQYKDALERAGFELVGDFDDSQSTNDLTGSISLFPGKHKELKTFKFLCRKV